MQIYRIPKYFDAVTWEWNVVISDARKNTALLLVRNHFDSASIFYYDTFYFLQMLNMEIAFHLLL